MNIRLLHSPARTQHSALSTHRSVDLRNLWIIAVATVAVLIVLTPAHEHPIIDDWVYAGSVRDQLATGAFHMPDRSQASLVGLTLWGTLWARIFGFSFTVLTASTLVLAFAGLVGFYCLARAVGVPPSGALFGTALMGFNPLFLHLSYSFMTDVPYLSLTVLACLFYVLGLQGRGHAWLWLGGLAAGYSYLIRQFGVLPPLGFLVYLGLDSLVSRKLRWREMVEVALLPALFAFGWYLFSKDWPPNSGAAEGTRLAAEFVGKPQWIGEFLNRSLMVVPLMALFAWAAIKMSRRRLVLSAVWAAIMVAATLAIALPGDTYSFIWNGNIIRIDGIDFFEYKQEPIWSVDAWKGIALLGALLCGPLLGAMTDSLISYILDLGFWILEGRRASEKDFNHTQALQNPKSKIQNPIVGVYLGGAATYVVSVALLGHFFDRYAVIVLPFLILFVVRGARDWSRAAWAYSLVALVLVASFTVLAQADFTDHDTARWQGGQWLHARAPLPIHVGYDWDNWIGPPSGQYEITDVPIPDWRLENTFPYLSRLAGFAKRFVLAQSAPGAAELHDPSP